MLVTIRIETLDDSIPMNLRTDHDRVIPDNLRIELSKRMCKLTKREIDAIIKDVEFILTNPDKYAKLYKHRIRV